MEWRGTQRARIGVVFRLVIILLLTTSPPLFGQIEGGKRQDVPFGARTNLQQFGGPNVEIVILSKEHSVVEFAIVDNEHEVVSAQTNIDAVYVSPFNNTATVTGENHVVFHPVTARKSIRLENGIEVAGTRSEAYLLHEIADGPKVYLLDAVDTKQNECALLILAKSTAERNSRPIEERLRKIEMLQKEGVISDAEARKKRQEILANL